MKETIGTLKRVQEIDQELYQIITKRGRLPEGIRKLAESIDFLKEEKESIKADIENTKEQIKKYKREGLEAEKFLKKYTEERLAIEKSKDYNELSKEIVLQKLNLKLAEQDIGKAEDQIASLEESSEQISQEIKIKEELLMEKEDTLEEIDAKEKSREKVLEKERTELLARLDKYTYAHYKKLSDYFNEPTALSKVEHGACKSCRMAITPQQAVDIAMKEDLIICFYCKRILIDIVHEETEPKKRKKAASS